MNPTPIDRWYADPANRLRLETLLGDPVMKQAIELLSEAGLPTMSRVSPQDALVANAIANAERSGYFNFLRNLRNLTQPQKPNQEIPAPWSSLE